MNRVELIEALSDVADAVGANADEQRQLAESSKRLFEAHELEDATALYNQATGINKANERVLAVLAQVGREIAIRGLTG